MLKRIERWWRASGDLAGLRRLDDRLLSDIGLDRATLRDRVIGNGDKVPPSDPGLATGSPQPSCRC